MKKYTLPSVDVLMLRTAEVASFKTAQPRTLKGLTSGVIQPYLASSEIPEPGRDTCFLYIELLLAGRLGSTSMLTSSYVLLCFRFFASLFPTTIRKAVQQCHMNEYHGYASQCMHIYPETALILLFRLTQSSGSTEAATCSANPTYHKPQYVQILSTSS